MSLKRLCAMMVSVAMMGALLAGCGSKTDQPAGQGQGQESAAAAPVDTEDAGGAADAGEAADSGEEKPSWWVGDEPITITGMGSLGPLYVNKKDYNEIMAIQEFSKRTNLYFDWTTMTSPENEGEQINLSFASKKMPDFYMHINKNDAVKYGEQGALIDLWPLVEQYAPNIKRALEADPTILPMTMTEEGKLYVIPQVDADYRLASFKMMVIQKGWLDQLGLEVPETREEFKEVLTAFRDHASELSDQTVLPYSSYMGMDGFFDVFGWTYGMKSSKGYVKDGEIVYGVLQPEFQDTVNYVADLYAEGLIDPDLDANKDDATFEAKMTNNRVGVGYIGQGRFGGYNLKAGPTFENYEFIPLQPLKDDAGNMQYYAIDGLGKRMGLAVSINNEHPVETIQAWDFFYSEEGMELMNFGIEGDTFEMADGHYTYTDKIMNDPELDPNMAIMNKISPLFDWPTARIYDFERSLYGEELAKFKEINNEAGIYDGKSTYALDQLPVGAAKVQEYAALNADINTYITESIAKFIRGEWTIDANYEEFVGTLRSMGIDDLIGVMNEGYAKLK